MDVFVDGARHAVEPESDTPMKVVVAVTEALHARSRAVVAVKLDGVALCAEELPGVLQTRAAADVGRIDIESEDVAALVDECLRGLESHLPDLPVVCHELAAVFQGSQPEEGFLPFHQLAGIWEDVKRSEAMVIDTLGLSPETLEVHGVPIAQLHETLNEFLHEAADALEAGDCVTLGDLLEYELAPRAETEAEIVALLREQALKRFG